MITGIRSALSGLLGLQKKVEASAHNTANILTEDYKKVRVILSEGAFGQVEARSEKIESPGPIVHERTGAGYELVELSNVELTEEIVSTLLSRRFFQANLKSVQTGDEMLGSLLDIKK
jgi:flagellar basal body rod protein FlgG